MTRPVEEILQELPERCREPGRRTYECLKREGEIRQKIAKARRELDRAEIATARPLQELKATLPEQMSKPMTRTLQELFDAGKAAAKRGRTKSR